MTNWLAVIKMNWKKKMNKKNFKIMKMKNLRKMYKRKKIRLSLNLKTYRRLKMMKK
jgi:hypothetical protein